MATQLRQQIEQISREKNINPDVIIAAIEDAILTASKKYYKGAEDLRSRFNEETGQKVREAERDNVFAEYSGRVGEVVNGIVKRQEMGDFVVDLGRAEALLPRKEQSRAEAYQTGDRVRGAIGRGATAG